MSSASPWSQQQIVQPNFFPTILSPQENARLRSIAMPNSVLPLPASRTSSYGSSSAPSQHISKKAALSSSSSPRPQRRKRKSTSDSSTKSEQDEEDLEVEEPASATAKPKVAAPPAKDQGKKSSHNMIEKRYRNNLNDKIAELRDSVPSLRVMTKNLASGGHGDEDEDEFEDDLQGLMPALKLNKATILSNATEYIAHLEKGNAFLTCENAGMKARVDAFEILMMSRQQQQQ